MKRHPPISCILLLAVCAAAGAGAAAEPVIWPDDGDPAPVLEEAARYKGWRVRSFAVEGVPEELRRPLHDGLALAGRARLLGRQRPLLYPQTLAEDLARARLFLARRGHPYAVIGVRFAPEPAARRVAVTLTAAPGPAVIVAEVALSGVPEGLAARARSALPVLAGLRFTEERLQRGARHLEAALQRAGHARARVTPSVTLRDSTHALLSYAVEAGAAYRFGEVRVAGIAEDLVPLVHKEADIPSGAPYAPQPVDRAQESLRLLGLFRQVRLGLEDAAPGQIDVRADLRERQPRTFEISTGYWTDDQLRLSLIWQHRNLLGGGRGLAAHASTSRFRQEAGLSLWWPALLGARTRLTSGLSVERLREDNFELVDTELGLGAVWRRSAATTLRAGIAFSDVVVRQDTELAGSIFSGRTGQLLILSAGWLRDTADDRLYPTRGGLARLRLELSPPGKLSDYPYASLEATGATYRSLGHGWVAAGRLGLGLAGPVGEAVDLLPNKRFYAGGGTSMRGFKRHRLGPLDADGAPLGGEAKLEAGVELRFPLAGRLAAAWFVDAGQVWRDRRDVDPGELEVATGPGLMVQTPVGYIRADLGRRLTTRQPDEPRTVFHLSIGHPY